MAMLLREILEDDNIQIVSAANGELGIKKALEFKPDLIIMDIMMPVKDGITAIKELRTMPEFNDTPIFILSAKGSGHDENLVKELNIRGYLHKPFSAGQIFDEVTRALS